MEGLILFLFIIILPSFLTSLIGRFFNKEFTSTVYFRVYLVYFIAFPFVILLLKHHRLSIRVTEEDIYGTYVIDKSRFSGEQADWQYDNFRFEVTRNNQLLFEHRVYDDVWELETVDVSFDPTWENRRIRIHSDSTNHHIIRDNPTLYRLSYGEFYYVFESEKFGNVFFKKGEWKTGFWDIF